jgi:molybdenum cofactor cytidylyltransferase
MMGKSIGLLLLAAGASTRMGTPKQLMHYEGQSFLRRAAESANASVCNPVVVVLGANAEEVRGELERLPVLIVENRRWEEGMSSSIRAGLETLVAECEGVGGVVIMLCDQPFVTVEVINELAETHRKTGKLIVASGYGEACGVPVLFSNELFAELAALEGRQGAKQIIANHPLDVATVCFPEGAVDVDTPQDYERLRAHT